MLTCANLTLETNNKLLFKNLSFSAGTGSLIIIRGLNGSGKTSLLKVISGLIPASKGQVLWNNVNIQEDIAGFRSNLCFITSINSLNDNLTVFDNLHFWTKYRGEDELFLPAIRYFKIGDYLDEKFGALSSGIKRRIELTKLLLFKTNLWLLDEPELSLDKETRNLFIDLLKVRVREGGVVIMTTHNETDLDFANYVTLEDFHP